MMAKRVVVLSDLHCGHIVGLTPPKYNPTYEDNPVLQKLSEARAAYWKFYADTIKVLQPIDILIINGDAIDGKGTKSGATELITADEIEQCYMATTAIEECHASAAYMTYGTPYHTGDLRDFEDVIAKNIKAVKIGSHDWLDVNGLVFDYRHFANGSVIPHGRHTAIARDRLWNVLWSDEGYPRADIIIRSHIHYHAFCGGRGWLAMTTPALQGIGTKFGARRMSGTVDFGLISFDVEGKDSYTWRSYITRPSPHKPLMA
jgi:hypothetical protein